MKVYELLHKPASTVSPYKVCFSTAAYVYPMWLCAFWFVCVCLIYASSEESSDLQFDDACTTAVWCFPDISLLFIL